MLSPEGISSDESLLCDESSSDESLSLTTGINSPYPHVRADYIIRRFRRIFGVEINIASLLLISDMFQPIDEVLIFMLNKGYSPNVIYKNEPAVCIAAKIWTPSILRLLANYGADMSVSDIQGHSAFEYARNDDILDILLSYPSHWKRARERNAPLLRFIEGKTDEVVNPFAMLDAWPFLKEKEVAARVARDYRSARDDGTLLHWAARRRKRPDFVRLVELSDLNAVNRFGETPLHLAKNQNTKDILCRLGARSEAVDCRGRTAMARNRILTWKKSQLCFRDFIMYVAPRLYCTLFGNVEAFDVPFTELGRLVKHLADFTPEQRKMICEKARCSTGLTMLHAFVLNKSLQLSDWPEELAVCVNVGSDDKVTPLHLTNNVDVIQWLLDRGAHGDLPNIHGTCPQIPPGLWFPLLTCLAAKALPFDEIMPPKRMNFIKMHRCEPQ